MSSDVEITVESSSTVVGGEQEVIGVSLRSEGNLDFNTVVTRLVLLLMTAVMMMMMHFLKNVYFFA